MGTASQSQEEPSCLASTLCSQGAARSFKQVLSSHARYAHCHVSGDGIIIGYGRCYTHVHSAARPGLCGSHWKRGGGLEALPSPEFPCAQHGTLARAQQLALAYVIFHYSSTPSALERFAHLEAIVQLFCQRTLGGCLASFPEAITAAPQWAAAAAAHGQVQGDRVVKDLIKQFAELASAQQEPITTEELEELLLRHTLTLQLGPRPLGLANSKVLQGRRQLHPSNLAVAVSTADRLRPILPALRLHDLNLLVALALAHVGRAVATAVVGWEPVSAWSAPRILPPALLPASGTPGLVHYVPVFNDQLGAQAAQQSPCGYQRFVQRRAQEGALPADYEVLRRLILALDPALCGTQYSRLQLTPASPPETLICQFIANTMTCPRTRRWEWWLSLNNIRVYVREVYAWAA